MLVQNTNFFPDRAVPSGLMKVINEIAMKVKTPVPLVWCTVIGALAAAYQDKVRLERKPDYFISPNLFTCVIGEAGIGKTPAENMVLKPYIEFEAHAAAAMEEQILDWKAGDIVWNEETKFYRSEISRRLNNDESVANLKDILKGHLMNRSERPRQPKMLLRDATPAAALQALSEYRSLLYAAGEGGLIKPLLAQAAVLNSIYDGNDYQHKRASSGSMVLKDPRLTIMLQIQPKTFERIMQRQGYLGRDNGMWARFLFCSVPNPAGWRIDYGYDDNGQSLHLSEFQAQILSILKAGVQANHGGPPEVHTIQMSEDAKLADTQYSNGLQEAMKTGGYFEGFTDAATKMSTQVCKIASLFHCYGGGVGPLSADTYHRAAAMGDYHLHEFKHIFTEQSEVPREVRDPQNLQLFLARYGMAKGDGTVTKSEILVYGPPSLRDARRADAALKTMAMFNLVYVHRFKNAMTVILNPQFFQGIPPLGYGRMPPNFGLHLLPASWFTLPPR